MNITVSLHDAITAVCPINGVSIGSVADKATWKIDFRSEATAQQRSDAQAVLAAFDPLAQTAADIRAAADAAEAIAAKQDAVIMALVNATPAQIATFVANNFPSMATQNERDKFAMVLRILAVAVRPVAR